MLKVYFTASTSYNGELIPQYKAIFEFIAKRGVSIVSGYQVVYKEELAKDNKLTPQQIYNREKALISQADFIIAEVSKPSLGVGAEIVYGLGLGKPVLALVKSDYEDKISPILQGNTSENLYLEYYHHQGYKNIIEHFIKNIKMLLKHTNILKKRRGKLIVLDGGDGSGKTTQVNLLLEFFKKLHIPVRLYDFPQYYHSFHGNTVAKFLRGEFGNIDQVSPYLASLAYALDRASVKDEMEDFLKKGGYIIANRYATSNMAHQGAKFVNVKERYDFLKWVYELEYKIHRIPKEDIVIYLHVPWKIGLNLTGKKGGRKYLAGISEDIHEKDLNHRVDAEKMYLSLAKRYKHWVKIACVMNGRLLTPDRIQEKIIAVLQEKKLI